MTEKIRDHLANERTFLAWVRTALGLIGFGFVLARMGLFLREMAGRALAPDREAPPGTGREFLAAGMVFLVVGTILTAWSGWHYQRNLRAIESERFEPARGTVTLLTGVVLVGGLAIVGLVAWRLAGER